MRRVVCALTCALLLATALSARARDETLDSSLREEVYRVPVADTGSTIVVTSFRPRGGGPFPWLMLSHGTATTLEANRAIGRNRNPKLMKHWVDRGYAVLVPVRRGYGASGGEALGDAYGSCGRANFMRAGEGAAADLMAVLAWTRAQHDLDSKRWLLVGQSAGGFASIYAASKRPDGLLAVLAFAPGRGGNPDTRPGEPCASDTLAELFASIAPRIAVPVLWFYAENDAFIGPRVQKLWFESFRAAGGRGELVIVPPFPARRGHGVFPAPAGVPIWSPVVARFIKSHNLSLPY